MRSLASLIFILCAALGVSALRVQGQTTGPIVNAAEPKTASIDSIVYLSGYRLGLGQSEKNRAFFIQNGTELPAQTAGGWSTSNDLHNGPQTLCVIVPDSVVPGPAQIVVEFEGHRSSPATISITEWQLPTITRLKPASGAPGTAVVVEGEGTHVSDEIVITDHEGHPITTNPNPGINSNGASSFIIPKDAKEGVFTVRIGNRKYGKGVYTEPLTFTVTNDPLTVELHPSDMLSVAPGQWLDLQISNIEPLQRSELTEVAFIQAGKTTIVATPKPFRTHVGVPSALAAGEVQMQLRTWRDGRPSPWSEPAEFQLADQPLPPLVDSIRLTTGQWANLAPGPDRAKSFTVSPNDVVVLHGLWPVADASKLMVSLTRPGDVVTLPATEFDAKANWFGDVQVRLPESLGLGEWRVIVRSEVDGTQTVLPIPIQVVKKKA